MTEVTLVIEGKRVNLRRMQAADADDVVRWRSNPAILQELFADEPPTCNGHLRWLVEIEKRGDRHEFIIVERVTGRSIGTIGLSDIDRQNSRAEYGILIGEPDAHGKGYGREASELILRYAFAELELHRVYLHVFADNVAAIRLYERAGFRLEGTLRQHALKRGLFRDVIVMALLKDQWNNA